MNCYLFFDTETSGLLPNVSLDSTTLSQYPRLIQLAGCLYNEDGDLMEEFDYIVNPTDFYIQNSNIHGITQEIAKGKGLDLDTVLNKFNKKVQQANLIVAHNYQFDSTIIEAECMRARMNSILQGCNSFCTMSESSPTNVSISLQNLHFELFNENFKNHHEGLRDASMTAKCFFEMLKTKRLRKLGGSFVYHDPSKGLFDFVLDPENIKFFNAYHLIVETKKHIFLTGKAGTGKTTFLKYLKHNLGKEVITLAFTGVAAINAGGQTINSFFKLPPRPFIPNDPSLLEPEIYKFLKYTDNKKKVLKSVDVIVIDEVSMVRVDLLDVIDKILRIYRKKDEPFGGVQLILIGDLFQLPPIEGAEWSVISQFYKSPYFFSSFIIKNLIESDSIINIELDKIYRQNELEFIDLLNRLRIGKQTKDDLNLLNLPQRIVTNINDLLQKNYIVLSTTNQKVNRINIDKLESLTNDSFKYVGSVEGDFPDSMKSAPQELELKEGAQVMLLTNIDRLYNGRIGKVIKLIEDSVFVLFDEDFKETIINRKVWYNVEYTYDKEKHKIIENTKGSYSQFPLKLAWAITVHKSQGLTFKKVLGDLSDSFSSGQVYVALSRSTSLQNLKLTTPISSWDIKVDKRVLDFAKLTTPETTIVSYINDGRSVTYYREFRKLLLLSEVNKAFQRLEEAIRYRNEIFSETFQNFTKIYIEKYKNYQKLILDFIGYTKEIKIRLGNKEKEVEKLLKTNSYLEEKIKRSTEAEKRYDNLNNALNLELKKEKENSAKLYENLTAAKYTLEELSGRIRISEINLAKSNKVIQEMNKENTRLKSELKDLKSKWHNRIFDW